MCYRDMSFCSASKKEWCETDKPICTNTKCERHASNIPFDRIPKWEVFSISNFSGRCGEYKA